MAKSKGNVPMYRGTKTMKVLPCKYECGEKVSVGEEVARVTCWKCVNKMMTGIPVGYNEGISDEEFKRQTES
jgi:hypothetical protein